MFLPSPQASRVRRGARSMMASQSDDLRAEPRRADPVECLGTDRQRSDASMPLSIDELFPPIERVVYQRTTLAQVICQLRFPSILQIQAAPPVDFQNAIRHLFPTFEQSRETLAEGLPKELLKLLPPHALDTRYVFKFESEDEKWQLSLSETSIALTSTAYTQWDAFRDRIRPPLAALVSTYSPSFYTRIGLRYINNIDRSKLDLENVDWSDLINHTILGELASPAISPLATEGYGHLRMKLPAMPDNLFLRRGLRQGTGDTDKEYFIDADFYTEGKSEILDGADVLDRLNGLAGRTFRWCIRDRLHNAMVPTLAQGGVLETA